jgi:hypothetical protein
LHLSLSLQFGSLGRTKEQNKGSKGKFHVDY